MNFSGIFLTLILLFSSITFAGYSNKGYQNDLAALEKIVSIEFTPTTPFIKKAKGLHNLRNLIGECSCSPYFGKNKLIQKVIIDYSDTPLMSEEKKSKFIELYGNTLIYPFDGGLDQYLKANFKHFENQIIQIEKLKITIHGRFKNIRFDRVASLVYKIVNPNKFYLSNLNIFNNLSKIEPYRKKLSSLTTIIISDEYDSPLLSNVSMGRNWGSKVDDIVHINFTMSDIYWDTRLVNTSSFIKDLLDITLIKGFNTVRYYNIEHYINAEHRYGLTVDELKQSVEDLNIFLTPLMSIDLASKGVKVFELERHWEDNTELLSGSTLQVGYNLESMQAVYDLVF